MQNDRAYNDTVICITPVTISYFPAELLPSQDCFLSALGFKYNKYTHRVESRFYI